MSASAAALAASTHHLLAPRPFLKWAGGKRQLLPELLARLPQDFAAASPGRRGRHGTYHEPFVGGGALFFALRERGLLERGLARLSDINPELVNAYQVVRDRAERLIKVLADFRNEERFFYALRAEQPQSLDALHRAARFIYLNKTCFNGLYRENRSGGFNVPFGRYAAPKFCAADELRAASCALRGVCIEVSPFEALVEIAAPGDFVYCDPPYVPATRSASFTGYSKGGFDIEEQKLLAHVIVELGDAGVSVLLSNSAVPITRALYKGLHVEQIHAKRAINSRGDRRGPVPELLVATGPLAAELRVRAKTARRRRPGAGK